MRLVCQCLCTLVLVLSWFSLEGKGADELQRTYQQAGWLTAQDDKGYALGVSGHVAVRLENQTILMAGGCNFPDKPAVEGGVKHFYDHIYVSTPLVSIDGFKTDEPLHQTIEWRRIGSLPQPTAYAGSVMYRDQLIVVGGQTTGGGELSEVYALSIDREGKLHHKALPALPSPRSSMSCTLIGSRLYIVGGSVNGRLTNSLLSLDLEHVDQGWRRETPYPSSPLLKVLSCSAYDTNKRNHLYVWGVFAHSEGEQGVSEAVFFARLNPNTGKWLCMPLPSEQMRNGASFGGGLMFCQDNRRIILAGGVQTKRFLPALFRAQAIRRAKRLGDMAWLSKLNDESKVYLSQPTLWYNFGGNTLVFDTKTGIWKSFSSSSYLIERADATITKGLVIGGEIKPGIRTPMIYSFPTLR